MFEEEAKDEMKWEVSLHPPHSPDIAPSDYHLFRSMAPKNFAKHEEFKNGQMNGLTRKIPIFYDGIHKLSINWNVRVKNGA